MRELMIVLEREFRERVRSRSFIISTIVTPLFIAAFGLGPLLFARNETDRPFRIALVDESPDGLGEAVAEELRGPRGSQGPPYLTTVIHRPLVELSDSLSALLRSESLDAYLHLPSGLPEDDEVRVWSSEAITGGQRGRIQLALASVIQEDRAARMGLATETVQSVMAPVTLTEVRVADGGQESQGGARAAVGFAASFLLYMMILLYGVQVMRSAQEEKSNRISEILISSMSAPRLMLGKVLGVGSTALLQVTIWIALGVAVIGSSSILERVGAPPDAAQALLRLVGPASIVVVVLFIILGFFLYATLFAALGAAAENMEDAQRFTFPLTMPLFIPLMMAQGILSSPDRLSVVVLSWVPLTAPLVMPARFFGGGASLPEVAVNAVWLVLCIGGAGWVAGRIYRAAILNTGRKPGWGDMVRWARAR